MQSLHTLTWPSLDGGSEDVYAQCCAILVAVPFTSETMLIRGMVIETGTKLHCHLHSMLLR